MLEVDEAIIEIQNALSSFGTPITYRRITQGVYNPLTGVGESETDSTMKALIKKSASESTERSFDADYERALMIYTDIEPTKKDKVVFNSVVYNIVYIAPFVLQGKTFKYEILISR